MEVDSSIFAMAWRRSICRKLSHLEVLFCDILTWCCSRILYDFVFNSLIKGFFGNLCVLGLLNKSKLKL